MRVDAVGEALNHPLEARHPRRRQVAVLQHHPIATPQRRRDERLGHRALPLAERRRAQPVSIAALGGKLEERGERIGAAGEDEDQRRAARRVSKGAVELERRPLGEAAAEIARDEVGHSSEEELGAKRAHQQQRGKRRRLGADERAGPISGPISRISVGALGAGGRPARLPWWQRREPRRRVALPGHPLGRLRRHVLGKPTKIGDGRVEMEYEDPLRRGVSTRAVGFGGWGMGVGVGVGLGVGGGARGTELSWA